jgi:hypothetical protein
MMTIIIQLFSIYLRANLTAQQPITKRVRVEKKPNKIQKQGNNNNNNNYIKTNKSEK